MAHLTAKSQFLTNCIDSFVSIKSEGPKKIYIDVGRTYFAKHGLFFHTRTGYQILKTGPANMHRVSGVATVMIKGSNHA